MQTQENCTKKQTNKKKPEENDKQIPQGMNTVKVASTDSDAGIFRT